MVRQSVVGSSFVLGSLDQYCLNSHGNSSEFGNGFIHLREPHLYLSAMLEQANLDRDIRILLVGDPGVGKTSLIYALVNEEFNDSVPARMAEITIPADVTPQRVPSTISDYSRGDRLNPIASGSEDEKLSDEINRANVICLVYAADDDSTLARVSSFWMPFIRQCQHERHVNEHLAYKPVILIRNKIDLNDSEGPLGEVLEIISSHPEIEAYIDVSAKLQQNVSELFVTAQKTILYPLTPLYDIHWRSLTRKCRHALTRVFRECDLDKDNVLNDHEINRLQTLCFGSPLQPETLMDVKAIIQQSIAEGVINDCITLEGFLFLHLLSIERGKHDITWTVLRQHGYGEDLIPTSTGALDDLGSDIEDDDYDNDNYDSLYDDYDEHNLNYELDESIRRSTTPIRSLTPTSLNPQINNRHDTASLQASNLLRIGGSGSRRRTLSGSSRASPAANDNSTEKRYFHWLRSQWDHATRSSRSRDPRSRNSSSAPTYFGHEFLLTAGFSLAAATLIGIVLFRYLALQQQSMR